MCTVVIDFQRGEAAWTKTARASPGKGSAAKASPVESYHGRPCVNMPPPTIKHGNGTPSAKASGFDEQLKPAITAETAQRHQRRYGVSLSSTVRYRPGETAARYIA
jgi:hypothetical protein